MRNILLHIVAFYSWKVEVVQAKKVGHSRFSVHTGLQAGLFGSVLVIFAGGRPRK
jgi:hypothetical protein